MTRDIDPKASEQATEAMALAEIIEPMLKGLSHPELARLLAGRAPAVQSAVLADLLAMWIAGHINASDAEREALLEAHVELARSLIPVNRDRLLARLKTGGSG